MKMLLTCPPPKSQTIGGGATPTPSAPQSSSQPAPSPSEAPRKKKKTNYLKKARMLYVGDSIAHNIALNQVEEKMNARIIKRKAYSSVQDRKARWPNSNVRDVTNRALDEAPREDKYEHIILSAPSVDITNLDTSIVKPNDNIDALKQEIVTYCKNMMATAENAILKHPEVKKVVILEHPPRFDIEEKDPLGLKPEFAKYANNMYRQLWFQSKMKDRIVIGQHKLECSEQARIDRYMNKKKNKYDGVHMYGAEGRKAYTENILSILTHNIPPPSSRLRPRPENSHKSCPQTKYMNTKQNKSHPDAEYSVPVQNRFNVLGN